MEFTTKGHIVAGELKKEDILNKVSAHDIFKYYITSYISPGKAFCSELRKDRSPSCSIKILGNNNAVYKDFSNGEVYGPIKYVQRKYGLQYHQALVVVSNDFNLALCVGNVPNKTMGHIGEKQDIQPKESIVRIRIVSIPFTKEGLLYWIQYGITVKILDLFEVKQLQGYYLKHNYFKVKRGELAFSYHFGNYRYKILKPDSDNKWFTNCNASIIQGFNQLPEKGKLLIITKSNKDIMTLRGISLYAVAPQSESTVIPEKAIEYLKERWKRIIIWYDNDKPGVELASKHSLIYKAPFVHNPIGESKDLSDYRRDHGEGKLKELIKQILNGV
jgi:hypothetical protein